MATIGNTFFDLIDLYKSTDGKGQFAEIIEMLAEMNPILDDAIAIECNKGTRHMHTVRTGLPQVVWGKLYKGISQSKSSRAQVEDVTGFVEALSTIDERILKLSAGKEGAIRLTEAKAFLEAMNQEVSEKIFYGNSADDPEEFMGLAPRFNDVTAPNGNQIIKAGGTGADNTSIWLITWDANACSLLYPEGTSAGVTREDKGSQRVLDGNNNAYYAKEEMFTWHVGLAVADWRYVVRICNIDVSDIAGGAVDLYDFLRKAYYQWEGRRSRMGKAAIYCNSDVLEALDALATNSGTADNFTRLRYGEIEGKQVLTYRGIPLRESDAILNTEALVA